MMDLQKEQWVILCDDCDEALETEKRDAEEALQVALECGWSKSGKYHYCEQCSEDHGDDEGRGK